MSVSFISSLHCASHPSRTPCPQKKKKPLTGYEPNLLDNFDHSETSAMIFQDESRDIVTEPSYSCDAELDDEIIGRAPSSPPNRRQAYHSHEERLLPAKSFFAHTSTVRPVHELSSCRQKSSLEMENETFRFLLERKKKQILADCDSDSSERIRGHQHVCPLNCHAQLRFEVEKGFHVKSS